MVRIPEEFRQAGSIIPDYKINLVELGSLNEEKIKQFKSDFQVIAAYVRYQNSPKELRRFIEENRRELDHPRETQYAIAAITRDHRYL